MCLNGWTKRFWLHSRLVHKYLFFTKPNPQLQRYLELYRLNMNWASEWIKWKMIWWWFIIPVHFSLNNKIQRRTFYTEQLMQTNFTWFTLSLVVHVHTPTPFDFIDVIFVLERKFLRDGVTGVTTYVLG